MGNTIGIMGAISIKCSCGSERTSPIRTLETDVGIYEHIFVCLDCDTTMVFRMAQILSARSDPNCLV